MILQGLGLEYCRGLAQQGCCLLIVVSRSGTLPANTVAELAAAGCVLLSAQGDSCNAADLQRVLQWVHEELPPIDHFAHAAGISAFAALHDMDLHAFASVANVKVRVGSR